MVHTNGGLYPTYKWHIQIASSVLIVSDIQTAHTNGTYKRYIQTEIDNAFCFDIQMRHTNTYKLDKK